MKLFKILKTVLTTSNSDYSLKSKSLIHTEKDYKSKLKALKKLFPFIKPYKCHILAASTFLIITSIIVSIHPLFIKYIIDDVLLKKNTEDLILLLVAYGVVVMLSEFTSFSNRYIFINIEKKIILDIQKKLFQRLIHFPKSFFDNKKTGYLTSRLLSDVYRLRLLFSRTFMEIFMNFLKFIFAVIILMIIHWKLTLLSLIILPFFIASVKIFGDKINMLSHRMMEKTSRVSGYLNESISGMALIKTFAAEEIESQKIYASLKESMDADVEQETLSAFSQLIIGIFSSSGTMLMLWFGGKEILAGHLTIGSFVAFFSYMGYIYGPAKFLATAHILVQFSIAASSRIFSLFDLIPENEQDNSKININKLCGSVKFSNVNFSYNNEPILKDISFEAKPGEYIAIVGPTGVGKSTLVNLIIGLYPVSHGNILFDNIDSSEISLKSLRNRIGIVMQETFLFDDTIANNILYSKPDTNFEEMERVAKLSNSHDFISKFEKGYNTIVGERGVKLSIGQKQRISIARVLLKDPDILIFDEPTSALDALTEKTIKDVIFNKKSGKTTFIIAHRLSTVILSDKIIVLDKGRIVQEDHHLDLLKQEGLYKKMYREQFLVDL